MGGVLGSISVDVCEKGDSYELHASLPGVPKENVKVTSNPPLGQPSVQAAKSGAL